MFELKDLKFRIIHKDDILNKIISKFEIVYRKINNIQDTRFNESFSKVITTLKKVHTHIVKLKALFINKKKDDKLLKLVTKKLTALANDLDGSLYKQDSYRGINIEEKQEFSRLLNLLQKITNQENEYSGICKKISKKLQKIYILLKEDITIVITLRDYCLKHDDTNELLDALQYMLQLPPNTSNLNTTSNTIESKTISEKTVDSACTENEYDKDKKCIVDLITSECLEEDVIVNEERKTNPEFGECYNYKTYEKLNGKDPMTRQNFVPLRVKNIEEIKRKLLAKELLAFQK